MLHLRKNESYVVPNETPFVTSEKNERPLVPKINVTPTNKYRYGQWLHKYETEFEEIWNSFVEMLMSMEQSERYVCHYDLTSMKQDFKKLCYMTSDNSYKWFI